MVSSHDVVQQRFVEQIVKVFSHDRVLQRFVEQIVAILVPQFVEYIGEQFVAIPLPQTLEEAKQIVPPCHRSWRKS